ncbi:amidohydrolase [Enterocloster asparagiformis]|uniref:amidohydrolase n=1 Tax=Enterocloster asparagiformis TaxID=333367 RepID=UPI0004B15AE3|nr:amidohydrolase [Enterocloster asparagiformis]
MSNPSDRTIEQYEEQLKELARKLWNCPEVAFEEENACRWTAEMLKVHGFAVETGYAGVSTAVRGVWGSGHPVIGFVGEYDALPGLSQKVSVEKEPVVKGGPGHGCGHNLLSTACLGGALGLKAVLEERGISGTVVFYGCPAEEVLTGKVFMARNGAFRELDVALGWHGGPVSKIPIGTMTANTSALFKFTGISAHAAAFPEQGRSALDAVELMDVAANYLREHVPGDVRMHYAIKDGGGAPNVVPEKASVLYYVRAMSRENVDDAFKRLIRCAEGAAWMTETKMEMEVTGGCYNTMSNMVLAEVFQEVMEQQPLPVWTEEELDFAAKLNEASPQYEALKAAGQLEPAIYSQAGKMVKQDIYGSTDFGDLEHIVPGISIFTVTCNRAAPAHSWQVAACAGSSIGEKGMIYGSKVLAKVGEKLLDNPELIERAWEEFRQKTGGKEYTCPIPDSVPVPVRG